MPFASNCPPPTRTPAFQPRRFLSLLQHGGFEAANVLCSGKMLMNAYSPGLNCRDSGCAHLTVDWMSSADSKSWYQRACTNCKFPEEARAKQTPVDECDWTFTQVLLYLTHPTASEKESTIYWTQLYIFCMPPRPETTASFKTARKVG